MGILVGPSDAPLPPGFRTRIPAGLIAEAKTDPFTGCHVNGSREYIPLFLEGRIVGFCDPRREAIGWRVGPLYVTPLARRMGVAGAWMRSFPERPMVSFIVHTNEQSAAFHASVGFSAWRRNKFGVFWRRE